MTIIKTKNDLVGVFNESNNIEDIRYDLVETFHESNNTDDLKYDYVSSNALTLVKKNRYYGVADDSGNMILDCIYDSINIYTTNLIRARKGTETFLFNREGNAVDFIYEI